MRRALAVATLSLVTVLAAVPAASASTTDPSQPAAGNVAEPVTSPSTPAEDALNDSDVPSGTYSGDPVAEAALVAAEDRRLIDVNLVSKGILVPLLDVTHPFRVTGTAVSTLVLTAREAPYTLDEIAGLAPTAVVKGKGGVYDLNESIVILKGATLDVHGRGALELRMASQPAGFVSIVSAGGTLVMRGTSADPAVITSWDAIDGTQDTKTSDGRAYIRAMGGQVSLTNANFSDLGFWSGNTGGIALTGLVQTFGLGLGTGAATADPGVGVAGAAGAGANAGGKATDPAVQPVVTTTDQGVIEDQVGSSLVPEGVTAYLANLRIDGNAFGVFAANTTSLDLRNSAITHSLVDGVVFHRQVLRSSVESTSSNNNVGDGFRISRGSDSITLQDVTASDNGRNGITINAGPLATGPSAVGLSTKTYGNHTVRDSVLTGNAASGITVLGGDAITLSRNRIESSPFGIVVQKGTSNLRVEESTFDHIAKQSIALRDGVAGTLTQNVMRGGAIGIYLRDSAAQVDHNTISGVNGHGISVVGAAEGTVIDANVISGSGTSPIDTARSTKVDVPHTNNLDGWSYQSFTAVVVDHVKRPLTLMWAFLAALLMFTAFSGFRQRKRGFGSPYRDRTPLHMYSRGLVDPLTVAGAERPLALRGRIETTPERAPMPAPMPMPLPKREPKRVDQTVGV